MTEWHASADVPATVYGPAAARTIVAALLNAWGLDRVTYEAQVVVSELVTNAVKHAPGPESLELELIRQADRLRISLADGSAIRPVVAELNETEPRGRGMHIVAGLTDRWGADEHRGGKRVWAEFTVAPVSDEPPDPDESVRTDDKSRR